MENKACTVSGVSWSRNGGEIYTVSATPTQGLPELKITGDFTDDVIEAFRDAVAIIETRRLGHELGVHIHVSGSLDGKSCGLPILVCIYSMLLGKEADKSAVFTGELSNDQTLYPIGGLTQKIATARLNGFERIVFPLQADPIEYAGAIMLCPVRTVGEALNLVFS